MKSVSLHGLIFINKSIIMEYGQGPFLWWAGQYRRWGFLFSMFLFLSLVSKSFFFSKLWIVLFLSCHAPDSKSSYIKDRFFFSCNLTSFLVVFLFSPFPVRGRVASIDFIDVDDVDDASEEKVVISEQLWEWFGLFCFV